MLVIMAPSSIHLADLVQQQFPSEDVEVIVDRRRAERRMGGSLAAGDRRGRERRQHDIRAELRTTGWAIIPSAPHVPADPTRPWQLPWLRTEVLLRMLRGTRWDPGVWPTAKAALREALAEQRRLQQSGWFN